MRIFEIINPQTTVKKMSVPFTGYSWSNDYELYDVKWYSWMNDMTESLPWNSAIQSTVPATCRWSLQSGVSKQWILSMSSSKNLIELNISVSNMFVSNKFPRR